MYRVKPKINNKHLREINQSWSSHFLQASALASISFIGSLKCMVHAILPDVFVTCGQDTVKKMQNKMDYGYKPVKNL